MACRSHIPARDDAAKPASLLSALVSKGRGHVDELGLKDLRMSNCNSSSNRSSVLAPEEELELLETTLEDCENKRAMDLFEERYGPNARKRQRTDEKQLG